MGRLPQKRGKSMHQCWPKRADGACVCVCVRACHMQWNGGMCLQGVDSTKGFQRELAYNLCSQRVLLCRLCCVAGSFKNRLRLPNCLG